MCKIMVTANQKGGVAKTSTVRNLSYSLAELGKRVLVVDFDPQSNLTVSFGIHPQKPKHTTGTLITKMLIEEDLPHPHEYINVVDKIDVLPANKSLTLAEVNLLTTGGNDYLKRLLSPLRDSYDYILIDTNPSLGALTINALTAADEVIIPIDPEIFAMTGLQALTDTIQRIKVQLNPRLKIAGVLFTQSNIRTTLYKNAALEIRQHFPEIPVYKSVIPTTVKVGEANGKGLSVQEYEPKNPAGIAYMELAKEVLWYAENQSTIKNAG